LQKYWFFFIADKEGSASAVAQWWRHWTFAICWVTGGVTKDVQPKFLEKCPLYTWPLLSLG